MQCPSSVSEGEKLASPSDGLVAVKAVSSKANAWRDAEISIVARLLQHKIRNIRTRDPIRPDITADIMSMTTGSAHMPVFIGQTIHFFLVARAATGSRQCRRTRCRGIAVV
jgi:hypothetical protein